jgi:hypothetical protein
MEIIEQTALPFPQVAVPAHPSETSSSVANLQVSEMVYFRALIWEHVATEVCPLPPESPLLDPTQIYVIWCLGSAKALVALPPSLSVIVCCKLLLQCSQ